MPTISNIPTNTRDSRSGDPATVVAKYLSELAFAWKQDCLRLDAQGYCSLRTDDEIDVLLEVKKESDELLLVADLGVKLQEHLAPRLLHENLFAKELMFASYCREASQGRVFLRYHYPVEALSSEKLGALISNFVDTARHGRDFVAALESGKETVRPQRSPQQSRLPNHILNKRKE